MGENFLFQFGKYVLLEKIAAGGMAELYRAIIATDQGFEKLVAIKRILPHLTDQQELVDAFIDEAKLAALLHHPNIVQIYDFGNIEGEYFLAMEHLFGQDLHSILSKADEKKMPLGLSHVLYIVSGICEGLDYAHNLKDFQGNPLRLVHRDINPVNVLVTYEGEVKIVDFGIAKAAGKNTKTREGLIKGKVGYMSPEQASGKSMDHRSDLFSTGIVLYEMLTRKPMYQGEDLEILAKVQKASFEPPENVIPDLPPKLYEILHRALGKDPDLRYQSGGEMLSDFEEYIHASSSGFTTRAMAQYMKTLFTQEIEEERKARAKISRITLPVVDSIDLGRPSKPIKKTRLISSIQSIKEPTRRPLWYGVTTLALLGGLFILSLPGNPLSEIFQPSVSQVQAHFPKAAYETASSQNADKGILRKMDLAVAALKKEHFEEAVTLFEEVLSTRPQMAVKVSSPYGQALVGQALSIASKDPVKAESFFLKALQVDPNNIRARFELGSLYLAGGDYPKAIEIYRNVIERDPQFHRAVFNLAYAYAVKKDFRSAEQTYRRLIELSPPYVDEALFNLAVVQSKQGKRNQSIATLEKALVVNPNNKEAKNYLQKLREGNRS